MSEPISNLTFDWIVGTGVQLSFDAATDVGSESRYLMSTLVDGVWLQFGVLGPVAVKTPGTGSSFTPTYVGSNTACYGVSYSATGTRTYVTKRNSPF